MDTKLLIVTRIISVRLIFRQGTMCGFEYIFVSTINILQFLWQVLIFLFLVVPLISLVWKLENEAELGKALLA